MKPSRRSNEPTRKRLQHAATFSFFFLIALVSAAQTGFVRTDKGRFVLNGKPYYYIGTNYWYGGLLGLHRDPSRGKQRLQQELDFLLSKGVTNLRVIAGVEGTGQVNGVPRVEPALQTARGVFDTSVLAGLDLLLYEMGKRNMKAIIMLSNNWEWSGGFLQYLNWNGLLPDSILQRKLEWEEYRNLVSRFYTCDPCKSDYKKQVSLLLHRRNSITGKEYRNDQAIMTWEIANEPRPMRPSANTAYRQWIETTAAFIKSIDKNHLVTTGHEGEIGTESLSLYDSIHADKNIDYLTIHIWPKNWAWFSDTSIQRDLPQVIQKTKAYIATHVTVAERLRKPLVIEEFGLPRDGLAFMPTSSTATRDLYYAVVFSAWQQSIQNNGVINGINFWAFGGKARPVKNQVYWKSGDDYMGDPPMEEQGLNTVFDTDRTTWSVIDHFYKSLRRRKN